MKLSKKILLCFICLTIISHNYLAFAAEVEDDYENNKDIVINSSSSEAVTSGYYSYLVDSEEVYLIGYTGEEETIEVPSQMDGMNVVGIYTECFSTAYNAKKIILPATIKAIYQDAFINCRTLEAIEIDSSNETYASHNGMVYSKDYGYLVYCPEGKSGEININESTFFICDFAFFNCEKITRINIPALLGYFGEGIGVGAFYNTPSLEEFVVDSNNKYFEVYDGVLYELNSGNKEVLIKCPNTRATCIDIPDSVKRIADYAFFQCTNLVGPLNLPASLESIGECAFANCKSLDGEIVIPDTTTSIARMAFYGCNSISGLTIGNGIVDILEDSFAYCTSLKEIIIPNSVENIGERAFFYCTGVESLTLGENVKVIDNWAFDYLTSLKGDLVIPNSVTKIGDAAFLNCEALDGYIIIGAGVTDIGASAFYKAENAKGILFAGDVPAVTEYSFLKPNITYYYLEGKAGFDTVFEDKDLQIYSLNPVVTFISQGEEYKTVTLDSYGLAVEEFEAPVVEDYEFLGWFYNEEYTQEYKFSDTFMNHTTIYAKIEPENSIVFEKEEIILETGTQEQVNFEYTLQSGVSVDDIVWESSDKNVATVDENGNITAIEKGEATITATYEDATDSLKVVVWKDENKLNIVEDSLTIEIGDETTLECEYHLINGGLFENIIWTSSDDNILTVENGKVVAIGEGTATVTATYEDVSDSIEVNVLRKNELEIISTDSILKEDEFLNLEYNYYFNDGTTSDNITWTSSDENIATVENGKVTAILEGTATIKAEYKDVSSSIEIQVVKKDAFEFANESIKVENNVETYPLEYTWYSYDKTQADIVWSSSNEEIATVTDGVITIHSLGDVIITAMCGDAVDTMIVNIVKANVLDFIDDTVTAQYESGKELEVNLDYYFNDGATYDDIVFASDNEEVVKVENNKLIEVGLGTATITATYSNLSDSITIKVVPEDNITFDKLGYILKIGEEIKISYQCYLNNEDYEHIVFHSSNEDVATINEDGTITTLTEGETTITATYNDLEAELVVVVSDDDYLKGDLNHDGKVNAIDASISLDLYKYNNATAIQSIIGDLNEDKRINSIDSSMILDIHKNNI